MGLLDRCIAVCGARLPLPRARMSYGSYGAHNSHMNWGVAAVLALGGFLCMIFGVREFAMSGNDSRAPLVREYDGAVDYWNAVGRSQFAAVSCAVSNLTGSGNYP